ncbi:MAG: MBL fold metallo-hydrolase [Alphaproteobacteria bacterium]|nr:MBL fold metallo-hydrolase [Alphaproteobacteria bacterium]
MIFRQLFDKTSSTYTYLLASRPGGEALIIDPVIENVALYLRLIEELGLRLLKAVDTHVHADHITGLGALRDHTRCITVMGERSGVDTVSMLVADGDTIDIEGLGLRALYTPGHTEDSYCLAMADRVFTGDTLLIRGSGRTDFHNGDSLAAYDSIFNKLLKLPDDTLVYPAHDYKGETVSTIGEERRFNPRLQVKSAEEYAALMASLKLANPQMMDVAVPANRKIGLDQAELAAAGLSLDPAKTIPLLPLKDMLLVDLRDDRERARTGAIPGSLHAPYGELSHYLRPGGILAELGRASGRRLVFYCAYGERSALAVKAAMEAGLPPPLNLRGGVDAWNKAGGPLEPVAGPG